MADDEVVEQVDVEQAAGGEGLGRQVQVVGRRRRVARGVVVDHDHARGVEPDRVAEELADADERGADVALVDRRDAQDVVLRVEHHDAQLLAFQPTHLEDQPVGDIAGPADRPATGGPVGQQSPAELERGHQLGGASLADPGQPGKLEVRGPRESREPVVASQDVAGEIDGGSPARPGPPDEGQELGRGQPGRTAKGESFAWPLGRRELTDRASVGGPLDRIGHRGTSPGRWHAAVSGVPGPGRREPADSPRHPDLEDGARLPMAPHRRLNRRFATAHPGRRQSRA